MISLDTEATGLDLYHGCRPFLVSICHDDGSVETWEWSVDPETRKVLVEKHDLEEIQEVIDESDEQVGQNIKYDVTGLELLFNDAGLKLYWPWTSTHDTLFSGHLLASNQPHDLATMCLVYLRRNIKPLERKLVEAVKQARNVAKSNYPTWRIATKGMKELPSIKEKVWACDYWLPRALHIKLKTPNWDTWKDVCRKYAESDSVHTLLLCQAHQTELKRRGLTRIYNERRKLLPIVPAMQYIGVTGSYDRLDEIKKEYETQSNMYESICTRIASEYDYQLELPKSGVNKSLSEFIFGKVCTNCDGTCVVTKYLTESSFSQVPCHVCKGTGYVGNLHLRPVKYSARTGKPSLGRDSLTYWVNNLKPRSMPRAFIHALREKRRYDTSLSYIEGYERFTIPIQDGSLLQTFFIMHPGLNPTGSDTLRWSSQNPNQQNISKQSVGSHTLRYAFGPRKGREWWSLDAANLELRLPAYEADETEMIELFERPDDPPYYGSYHLLVFDVLHPQKFKKHGAECKNVFKSTWYQWTKNGNFAVQYGAMEESGTADRAYHLKGAQAKVKNRFQRITALNRKMIAHAEKYGFVETMPDKSIDPDRGYPLLCSRSKWGKILPTVPLNYHIQGTACWWMMRAMIKVQAYLDQWNIGLKHRQGYYMIMQVHDELVFDFPQKSKMGNLPIIRKVQKIMESCGDDIGVPTPVSVTYHLNNWSEGVDV